jgi:8-oxo-dGTP pyrophosphatase MutT (NUDIX family)
MAPIRNSAKAVIIRDGKILLIKKGDGQGGYYLLPGGGQEKFETFAAAVRRECREELGAEVAVGDLKHIREYIGRNHEFAAEDADVHQIEYMFACELLSGPDPAKATQPDDHQTGVEWVALDDRSARVYPKCLLAKMAGPEIYWGDVN